LRKGDNLYRGFHLAEWDTHVDCEEGIEVAVTETVPRLLEEPPDLVFAQLAADLVPRHKRRGSGFDIGVRRQQRVDVECPIRAHQIDEKLLPPDRGERIRVTGSTGEIVDNPLPHSTR
jgi:hypothetical protein